MTTGTPEKEQTALHDYKDPVRQLLTYGACLMGQDFRNWPDYLQLGLNENHVQELIAMVTDQALHLSSSESTEVWAPVHAWRALGQLKAEEAITPLISIFWMADDAEDDWVTEEMPLIMGMIGPEAISRLTQYMKDRHNGIYARSIAASSLHRIAEMHPEKKEVCIRKLTEQLADHCEDDAELNGYIIDALIRLKALESIRIIEKAFEKNCVDDSIVGDFEDIEIAFGLKEKRTKKREPYFVFDKEKYNPGRASEPAGRSASKKTGRNEPCPCGSGKKYKKCCLI